MDVTPQLIEQIDFAEKFRGYDPDQVDDFLERVGATLAELTKASRDAVERAERAEAELRSAPDVSRAPAAAMSDEEEAMQSTRTLMMAKRTADAAIADARQEAQKLVADARMSSEQQRREAQTEADRVIGEARVNADQMTQKATADANREYGARRDQVLAEIGDLESRKAGLAGQLVTLESRIEEYRAGLSSIHGAVASILDNPETALRAPLPGIDIAALARPVTPEPAATPRLEPSEPPAPSASAADPAPVADPFGSMGGTGATASGVGDQVPSADGFAASTVSPSLSEGDVNGAHVGSVDAHSADSRGGSRPVESRLGEAGLPDPRQLSEHHTADTRSEPTGGADLPWSGDNAGDQTAATDPWAPGSWGESASFADPADAFGAHHEPTDSGATSSHAFSEFPSEGLPVIGQDRYTRDLDEAVNQPGENHDDAMSAFFEGDDAHQPRRFGRRR